MQIHKQTDKHKLHMLDVFRDLDALSERKGFIRTIAHCGKSIRKGWRDNYFIIVCYKCVKAYWLSSKYKLKMLCVLAGTSDSGFETMCYCVEKLAYPLSWLQWCAGSISQSAYRNQCHVPHNLSVHPNSIYEWKVSVSQRQISLTGMNNYIVAEAIKNKYIVNKIYKICQVIFIYTALFTIQMFQSSFSLIHRTASVLLL